MLHAIAGAADAAQALTKRGLFLPSLTARTDWGQRRRGSRRASGGIDCRSSITMTHQRCLH